MLSRPQNIATYIDDNTNFPACLHVETISLLLFRVDNSGLKKYKIFFTDAEVTYFVGVRVGFNLF